MRTQAVLRGSDDKPPPPIVAAPTPPPLAHGAWGTLALMRGSTIEKSFDLCDDRELVGRGKFCSIRIIDKSVAEAHFVLGRGGELLTSLPGLTVEVGGLTTRRLQLADGDAIHVGTVVLVYNAAPDS